MASRAGRLSGPVGNAPRDLRDDFVGLPAEVINTGPPPRWPPNPKRIKKNTFHAKVTGNTAANRPDRFGHYRRGGWVAKRQDGGDVSAEALKDAPIKKPDAISDFKRGGHLSAKQRQSLPSSDFALPGKGKGPKGAGSGSYPIPDESHARNALARSSGKPVAAAVRRKVEAKFPDIKQRG